MQPLPFVPRCLAAFVAAALALGAADARAAQVSRLTPPSELFSSGEESPVIARFLPGQLFDLQATVQPDAGSSITNFAFYFDNSPVSASNPQGVARTSIVTETGEGCIGDDGKTTGASGCKLAAGLPGNTAVVSLRAISRSTPGVHTFKVLAQQSNGPLVTATGNFEIVGVDRNGSVAKNIIIFLGDGMGVRIAPRAASWRRVTRRAKRKAVSQWTRSRTAAWS